MKDKFICELKEDLKSIKRDIHLLKKVLRDKEPDVRVTFKHGIRKIQGKIEPESLRTYVIRHIIEQYETEANLHEMSLFRSKPVRAVKTSKGFEAWKRKHMKKAGSID